MEVREEMLESGEALHLELEDRKAKEKILNDQV